MDGLVRGKKKLIIDEFFRLNNYLRANASF